ncbi:Ser/Thr protein kinase RdoA (MazF antagonist) [Murinocardiopsis flavida]|uniref:Ser/Thr protein kinase RdoA (MazF antagonist) n=1 Tax=Murinocardiopsis flavida TaxID=645275 RepID=A0A2P8DDW4_9ACTN|nr:Ser/Thr protein kinase RdoA (MazF antagonist) [Murinocardiopsis flavida]
MFALPGGQAVAKVGRSAASTARAAREVRAARWLLERGVPAVRPLAGPVAALGRPVTFWERLPPAERPPSGADLGSLLRRLHALGPAPFPLPARSLLAGVDRWLRAAEGGIDPADAAYLRERAETCAAQIAALRPRLPPGPIHGDALLRNVVVGPDGPVLTDLEYVSHDLREHDLVVMALARDRYGMPEREYQGFTGAYGWDVAEWPGCAALRGARETASAAWVAQHAPASPGARAEFRRRVASLRAGDPLVRWHAW